MRFRTGVLMLLVSEVIKMAVGFLLIRPGARRYELEAKRGAVNDFRQEILDWLNAQEIKSNHLRDGEASAAYHRVAKHVEGTPWRIRKQTRQN